MSSFSIFCLKPGFENLKINYKQRNSLLGKYLGKVTFHELAITKLLKIDIGMMSWAYVCLHVIMKPDFVF